MTESPRIDPLQPLDNGRWEFPLEEERLTSLYQPVFSITHQREVGFSATLGSSNGVPSDKAIPDEHYWSPNLLHMRNFQSAGIEDRWLFVSVQVRHLCADGTVDLTPLRQTVEASKLPPHQLVISLKSDSCIPPEELGNLVNNIRAIGCLVAFEGLCTGLDTLDCLWKQKPDIVILEGHLLENAVNNGNAKRMLNRLVGLIHATENTVLLRGVDSEAKALVALQIYADFVQGRFLGGYLETPQYLAMSGMRPSIPDLFDSCRRLASKESREMQRKLAHYTEGFYNCAWALEDGATLEMAGTQLLEEPRVERLYLLADNGVQVGPSLFSPSHPNHNDPRFNPLGSTAGATWSRRSYFQEAMAQPGVLHTTKPYMSITSSNVCVTLSRTIHMDGQLRVFCCDLDWDTSVIR